MLRLPNSLLSFPVLFSFSAVGHENKKRCVMCIGRIGKDNLTQEIMVFPKKKTDMKRPILKYFKIAGDHFFPLLVKF